MPVAAGILDFVGGAFQLLAIVGMLIYGILLGGLGPALLIATALFAFTGILAVVGGAYALRRKKWGLAFAGSFTAFFPCLLWPFLFSMLLVAISSELLFIPPVLLGIATIVLTAVSKKEFEHK